MKKLFSTYLKVKTVLQLNHLIFPVSILLLSFISPKEKQPSSEPAARKEIRIDKPFKKINIRGDISVVLTNRPAGTLAIEGNENAVNNIKYRNKNEEFLIDAGKKKRGDQLTIFLSAITLKSMVFDGDGEVSSEGVINTNGLHIWLNGNINVEINIAGNVSVDAFDNNDLIWKPLLDNKTK